MKTIISILLLACFMPQARAQIEWQHCYGGTNYEGCNAIRTTFDGGYILAGYTQSNNDQVSGNHGEADFWVVKITAIGTIEWQKCYGGSFWEEAYDIRQTTDSGYIVVGYTTSYDGDVSGNHGGGGDMWVIKITSDGTLQWQKCLGSIGFEIAFSVGQTNDGGYIVAGITNAFCALDREFDYMVVKLNDTGSVEWANCYGGTNNDMATAVQQTYDGGYIIGGSSASNNGDVTGHHGDTTTSDLWVLKLSGTGSIEWEKSLGGTNNEGGLYTNEKNALMQTMDSGYVAATYTSSNDGDVTGFVGVANVNSNGWVVKLSESGTIQWNRCISVSGEDYIHAISQSADGGYVFAGENNGLLGKVSGTGSIVWVDTFGGDAASAYFSSIALANGDTCIAAGITFENTSLPDYHGEADYWVVKFGPSTAVANIEKANTVTIAPNPAIQYLSITASDIINSICVTNMIGQVVYFNDKLGAMSYELDVHDWMDGMYFVKVNNTEIGKFVKE